jgi:hypothetical protein
MMLTTPAVLLESGVVDLKSAFINMNSSALGVSCGPPGIGAKF